MPTRKELLEELADRLDDLGDDFESSSDSYRDAADAYEASAERFADASDRLADQVEYTFNGVSVSVKEAADSHGRSIERAGNDIMSGLIVGAVVLIGGLAIGGLVKLAMQRGLEIRRKTQMITSILSLHEKHGAMSYDFVLERSYAEDTDTEERRTLLNGLIAEGIVIDGHLGDPDLLTIDADGEEVTAYFEWLEDLTGDDEDDEDDDDWEDDEPEVGRA